MKYPDSYSDKTFPAIPIMVQQVIILIPVFNDGNAVNQLLKQLGNTLLPFNEYTFRVLVVDDGSTEPLTLFSPAGFITSVLHLVRNTGHQKAIAIGLSYIREHYPTDKILVMDGDGQDRADDAARMLHLSQDNPDKIIFARRHSRQESRLFRLFYKLYKLFFRLLTGKNIAFGNFSILPYNKLNQVVFYSEIWSHYAAGVMKTGLPFAQISTSRGKRENGKSKMGFSRLLLHGLSAFTVYLDRIAYRFFMLSLLLILLALVMIGILLYVKFFTTYAIPGWTSTILSSLLIILLQSFLISILTLFFYLMFESQRKFIPARHYSDYAGKEEPVPVSENGTH